MDIGKVKSMKIEVDDPDEGGVEGAILRLEGSETVEATLTKSQLKDLKNGAQVAISKLP